MGSRILSAVIGGVAGFLALFLREMGLAFGAAVLIGLSIYYVRSDRSGDVGWLLAVAGLIPAIILGRNAATSVFDPAVDVGRDTWLLFAVFAAVAVAGVVVSVISRRPVKA